MRDAEPDMDPEWPPGDGPPDRPASPHRRLVWAVLLASIAFAGGFPAIEGLAGLLWPPRAFHADGRWLEMLPVVAASLLIATWIFVFWSLIGSFLNVVVYRLPLGQSVVHGGSRCPRCSSPIQWYDNLPAVGWLNLDGRCRSCDLPIAPRYPIVESICAGVGTAVFFRELLSGGANLPGRAPDVLNSGVLRLFPNPTADLIGLLLYHCSMLCVLLVWGLIALDGKRVPRRSIAWAVGVASALPVVFPTLHPLGLSGASGNSLHALNTFTTWCTWKSLNNWFVQGLAVSVAGGVAGLVCGLVLESLLSRLLHGDASGRAGQPLQRPVAMVSSLTLVGVVCGWQGMLGTTVLLLVACLVQALIWSSVIEWPTVPPELLLAVVTFLHLCVWRQLVEAFGPWWPDSPTPACLVAPMVMAVAVVWALMTIAPLSGRPRPPTETDTGIHGDQTA